MSAPTGDWDLNVNGIGGKLSIVDDGTGNLTGTVNTGGGAQPLQSATWDETAQELTFTSNGTAALNYTGFLGETCGQMFPGPGQGGCPGSGTHWKVLAGTYGPGSSSPRHGWFGRQAQ
jgi:hypothetical protein